MVAAGWKSAGRQGELMIRTEPITAPRRGTHGWLKLFFAGVVFYFVSLAIMVLTGNPNLFPTVVLIGNFLVPVTYVAFLYEHRHLSPLSLPSIAFVFFYGG